jgi:hypothetical protein
MTRLSPRGLDAEQRDWLIASIRVSSAIKQHTERERLVAVTGRTPLHLVHDAEILRQQREMSCTSGGPPTVPTRRIRRRQRRASLLERCFEFLTRPRLALRERTSLAWSRLCACCQRGTK